MTKAKIIDAAFRVWGRDYYRKTSLSQLARELGVSKTALYRHFVNKQALTAAMAERFYDDFAASVRADFEQAMQAADPGKGIFTIVQSIAGYFARNGYALIFSLVNIYDRNLDIRAISEHIKTSGVDMGTLRQVMGRKYDISPAVIKMVFATLIFYVSNYHKTHNTFNKSPSGREIQNIVCGIYKIIEHGLGFSVEKTGALDFKKLEKQVGGIICSAEIEPLFKAVAEAVAEAGPWEASMEMVAQRLGLSKSSLYGHFKNKKDMIRRLFLGEFKRIIEFARQCIKLSANSAEQLYLGIYSIAVYLRSRPEILIAISWIRTRKLDIGKPEKQSEIFRLFEDVEIESLHNAANDEKQQASHWILFLLISILIRPYLPENGWQDGCSFGAGSNMKNDDIRMLYKYITLGLGGFTK